MATGSVAETTAHLASWCERVPRGLALVEYDSELACVRVVKDLRARLKVEGVPFHEFALPAGGGPRPVVRELLSRLGSLDGGVISVSGFETAFPLSGSHQEELVAFNFQRERLAERPMRQIWWLPVRVADAFRRGAYDLYSWFTVRLYLTEMIAPLAQGPPLESWIAESSGALPTSLDDARQRAAELARRFETALENSEKPVEELARELMEPALRALEEAGAEREARELERDLRRRAREKQRPFPPRVFISYSHDSTEHEDRVRALADRLREEGVDARLDQYEVSPPRGWHLWMEAEIEAADFVLVVATETYERRRRGREEKGKGLGVRFEGAILSQTLYDEALLNENVIPVVFASSDAAHVPIFLKAVSRYDLGSEGGYESLYRRLTDQPRIRKPPLGRLRTLAPRARWQRFAAGSIWNVPHRQNRSFTGREEELAALREALRRKGSAALGQTQAISGLGGIGKTQTAVEYANRYQKDYQAVLWVRAETEAELAGGFSDLATVLDLPEKDAKDQEAAIEAVKRWLESNASWLLVLDNADNPELVEPFLPVAHRGHVLLTSRARNLSRLEIARPVRLDTLQRDEAVAFLLKRTEREDAGEAQRLAAAELAAELGDLPLALVQAAAYIHDRQCRFDDYLASYRERPLRLLESGEPDGYSASVATTWALNFEAVERASAASAEILHLSAFLAPERIPVEILTLGAMELGSTLSSALVDAAEDPLALGDLLRPLSRYSLIEQDPETRTFSVHRMVKQVVRAGLDQEDRHRWAERAVRALRRAFPEVEVPTWPLCERLVLQTTAALELVDRYGLELEPAADLFKRAGIYSSSRGRHRQAAPFLERSLGIREKMLGPEHPDVASSLNNLANLYYVQGDYASAAPLHQRSLGIREKVLGPKHPEVATSLNNLALVYHDQGDSASAEPLYERSLAIWENVLGTGHPHVAKSLNNLARLHQAQKDYASAAPLYERSLGILEKKLGPEHPDVASSLNNLANLHSDRGDYASAARLLERSLAIREKVLRPEHEDVAQSLASLALLHRKQGDAASAAPLFERSLTIFEKALGPEHPDVATTLKYLANLHADQGDAALAASLYERSLAIREKVLGPEHPDVATVLQDYARLLAETDRAEEAAELEARAKAIRASRSAQGPSKVRE